jgi:hypothetical protein
MIRIKTMNKILPFLREIHNKIKIQNNKFNHLIKMSH